MGASVCSFGCVACLFVCLRLVYAPLVPECLWPPGCTSFDSLSIGVQLGQRVAREFHGKWAWVFGFGFWVLGSGSCVFGLSSWGLEFNGAFWPHAASAARV